MKSLLQGYAYVKVSESHLMALLQGMVATWLKEAKLKFCGNDKH